MRPLGFVARCLSLCHDVRAGGDLTLWWCCSQLRREAEKTNRALLKERSKAAEQRSLQRHLALPFIVTGYVQATFNVVVLLGVLSALYWFACAVQADIDIKAEHFRREVASDIMSCAREYEGEGRAFCWSIGCVCVIACVFIVLGFWLPAAFSHIASRAQPTSATPVCVSLRCKRHVKCGRIACEVSLHLSRLSRLHNL